MVNINRLELTPLQLRILRILFKKRGKELNQRQIAKLAGVTRPAIKKALPKLVEKELITQEKDEETKRWSISINKKNHKVIELKRVDNLEQIYETGLSDYLEEKFPGSTIILFGSYSKGEDNINSDIDIAIIEAKPKKIELKKYEKELERKININYYKNFKEINKHLKENLANGIIIKGGFEL